MEQREVIKIHSVCACCNNWGIGYKGDLPWKLPNEYNHFTTLSTGNPPDGKRNVVILGRKTWTSVPKSRRPLKNRINFVISRSLPRDFEGPDAVVATLDEAVALLQSYEWRDKFHEVFCAGGHDIYKLVQDSIYCGYIYLTRILADFPSDVFYPKLDKRFVLLPNERFSVPQDVQKESDIEWKVEVYEKMTS